MADDKEKIQEETTKMLVKWKSKRGALIMALHEIQGTFGYVPWVAMEVTSRELKIPMAQIYSVLTFYNYFKLKAPGKVIISICDGTACHIKGAPAVIQAFRKEFKSFVPNSKNSQLSAISFAKTAARGNSIIEPT